MINKTYLHPIRTSDYSNRLSSCHLLTSHLPSNKTSPYSKLKNPNCSIVQLLLLSSGIFCPPLHSPKNL